MTTDEQIFHSNRAWLSVITEKPRNIQRVNNIAIDRLTKLGYIQIVGSYVIATDKGRAYIKNLPKEQKSDI